MNLENIKIFKKGKIGTEERANYILSSLMTQMNNIRMYSKKSIFDDNKLEYYILIDINDINALMRVKNFYNVVVDRDYKKSIYEGLKIFGLQVFVAIDFNKDPIIVKYQK